MSWFTNEGKRPHHVIFSKTGYVRNIFGLPFTKRLGEKNTATIYKKIDSILTKNGFRKEILPDGDSLHALSLAEKGFIDRDLLSASGQRAVYFNEPCSLSVAIGGKDIISIRSLLSGLSVSDTRNIASSVEELLDRELEFAYYDHLGYVSATPSLCGSGAVFSSLLYLPALRSTQEIDSVRILCAESGGRLDPAFTYTDNCGDLYTLSYSPSHLCDESAAADGFSSLAECIIDREYELERMIFTDSGKIIIDKAWRAYGQMLYARRLAEDEMLTLLSSVRFALAVADGDAKLPPLTVKDMNLMLGEGLNASCAMTRQSCASEDDCQEARAEFVSKLLYTASGNQI